ncbi:hypothetical protein [Croceicoccus gelatinilyticus]|uniref:hypothetical protein n=1 Tax=Croceicoccus gelatinilyticus TaxID=2835536 RepID=UPI001BCAC250|nr:hypothetical protein [Croceicoccus gelatinilyticus]MBS7670441.1 hypothetical protein [Croceicoccus gelatinilyticus]
MKEMLIGGVVVAAVGLSVFFAPDMNFGTMERVDPANGPLYSLTPAQVSEKLTKAPLPGSAGPFGTLDVKVTSRKEGVVRYEASGSHARISCKASVHDARSDAIQVLTSCDRAAADGAAAKLGVEITNNAFNELVHSTLQGRAYDRAKVEMQNSGAVMKNLPQMQRDALKMQSDFSKMEREIEQDQLDREDRAWLEGDVSDY